MPGWKADAQLKRAVIGRWGVCGYDGAALAVDATVGGGVLFRCSFRCGLKRRYYYGRVDEAGGRRSGAWRLACAGAGPSRRSRWRRAPAPEGERFNRAISGQSAPAAPRPSRRHHRCAGCCARRRLRHPHLHPLRLAGVCRATPAQPISQISVSTGSGAPVKPEAGGAGPSDDLTRIRGIDTIVQKQLKEPGHPPLPGSCRADRRRCQGPQRQLSAPRAASSRRTGSGRRRSWRRAAKHIIRAASIAACRCRSSPSLLRWPPRRPRLRQSPPSRAHCRAPIDGSAGRATT